MRASLSILLFGGVLATPGLMHADVLPSPLVTRRLIVPSLTNPAIGACGDDECPDRGHRVYLFHGLVADHPSVPPKLLVILGAHCTDAGPHCGAVFEADYEPLARVALLQGFRVIELDYPNRRPPSRLCGDAPACHGELRGEIAFGVDTAATDKSTLSAHRQDAIVPRLLSLLRYLDAAYPGERWDRWTRFDSTDGAWQVRWADVVLAGHSGYAAFIAFRREVSRVVMFAEPADRGGSSSSHWIHGSASTPLDRFYGLVHTLDHVNGNTYEKVTDNWWGMGVPSPRMSVDGVPVPDVHQLETSLSCGTSCSPHFSIAEDAAVYALAWRHMLGPGN
jgi:hypothetical protein